MQCITVQYTVMIVQYGSTVQGRGVSAVQCRVFQCSAVQCSAVQFCVLNANKVQCIAVKYSVVENS